MHYLNYPMQDAIDYCRAQFPNEGCGFFVKTKSSSYKFYPAKNIAKERKEHFKIAAYDFVQASELGSIVAVVHSHTQKDSSPSESDVESFHKNSYDWVIIGLEHNTPEITHIQKQLDKLPALYGNQFIWGVTDCYSFVRNYYRIEHSIILPDFYRKDNFWKDGEEIYLNNFTYAGFVEGIAFEDIRVGDVILFKIGSLVTTHAAVYLGNNLIGHHLKGRLSTKEAITDSYKKRITKIIRYKDFL